MALLLQMATQASQFPSSLSLVFLLLCYQHHSPIFCLKKIAIASGCHLNWGFVLKTRKQFSVREIGTLPHIFAIWGSESARITKPHSSLKDFIAVLCCPARWVWHTHKHQTHLPKMPCGVRQTCHTHCTHHPCSHPWSASVHHCHWTQC